MSVGGEDNEGVLVKLTRMEGKLDLSNMRHDQTDAWKVTVDGRLHSHSNRIGVLEAKNTLNEGKVAGVAVSTKVMWIGMTALGGGLIGIAALVARAFG